MLDGLRRVALVTSGLAELTKHRAERLVKDLVKTGDLSRDQASIAVKELLRKSAENRRELTNLIQAELRAQVEALGLASRRDLERLERRITRLEERAREAKATSTASGERASLKKATGPSSPKKSPRKKASTKTTAKKTAAKKTSSGGASGEGS